MNRNQILASIFALLIVVNVVYHIWANWGLVTVHAKAEPISKVVSQIQRQGHITIKTDLPPETQVTMNVDKVPLGEALETLAAVTDARWRLSYFVAADKSAIRTAEDSVTTGQRPDGWKFILYPFPQMFATDGPIPDPRKDKWNVTAQPDNTLQAYLDDAGKMTNASFFVPESWNPTVKSAPKAGEVSHVLPKLASAAGGKYDEVFTLTKSQRRGPRDDNQQPPQQQADDQGGQPNGGFAFGGGGRGGQNRLTPEIMEARAQAEIEKLPASERPAAQARFNKEREFWKTVRDLPPDQRQAKIEEHFNDPEVQQAMDDRQARNDARRTPEQRLQRYQRYVNTKYNRIGK